MTPSATPPPLQMATTMHAASAAPDPFLVSCPHLRTRVKECPAGGPDSEYCDGCGRQRTLRPLNHLHFNEDTHATGWLSEEQVRAGQVPEGSVVIETEYEYGPWVAP